MNPAFALKNGAGMKTLAQVENKSTILTTLAFISPLYIDVPPASREGNYSTIRFSAFGHGISLRKFLE